MIVLVGGSTLFFRRATSDEWVEVGQIVALTSGAVDADIEWPSDGIVVLTRTSAEFDIQPLQANGRKTAQWKREQHGRRKP